MKTILLILFMFSSATLFAQTTCTVSTPYYGMFDATNQSFDQVLFYNSSTCPFTLPAYDAGFTFTHSNIVYQIGINSFTAPYLITGSSQNLVFYSFDHTYGFGGCRVRGVSTGTITYLPFHYFINGGMTVTVSNPGGVNLCTGVF
jgi:hypothetical protein